MYRSVMSVELLISRPDRHSADSRKSPAVSDFDNVNSVPSQSRWGYGISPEPK
jgi:hypothetical protein